MSRSILEITGIRGFQYNNNNNNITNLHITPNLQETYNS